MPSSHSNFTPIPYHCVRHTYYYYPFDWTDEDAGKAYKRGYYDEDGCYYEDVAFLSNGRYENILCQCEYCDTVSKLDWSDDGPLICPQCGGSLRIKSALDEFIGAPSSKPVWQDPDRADRGIERRTAEAAESGETDTDDGRSDEDSEDDPAERHFAQGIIGVLVFILCVAMFIVTTVPGTQKSSPFDNHHNKEPGFQQSGNLWIQYGYMDEIDGTWMLVSANTHSGSSCSSRRSDTHYTVRNSKMFGPIIYLKSIGDGICVEAREEDSDRKLVWKNDLQCYWNEESKVYIWYNTNMAPPVWQYWYEPISGDFGSCGWMEYDYENEGWRIESTAGKWIEVPEKYDLSALWRIDGLSASPEDYIEEQDDSPEGIVTSEADNATEENGTTTVKDTPTENNSSWDDDTSEELGSPANTGSQDESDEDLG